MEIAMETVAILVVALIAMIIIIVTAFNLSGKEFDIFKGMSNAILNLIK